MKKKFFYICFFIILNFLILFLPSNQKVEAESIPIHNELKLIYENEEFCYTYPTSNSFEIEFSKNLLQNKIKQVGVKNFLFQKRASGLNYINSISTIYPNFANFYKNVQEQIEQELKEPKITFKPNTPIWKFEKSQTGIKIDEQYLFSAIASGEKIINLKVQKQYSHYTKENLEKHTILRSKEYTTFFGSEEGRKFNIIKSLNCFNGLIVMPNEEISFQNVLSKNDNGEPFKESIVIVNGEFTKGVGGGICQASTTIYNAVLMAGLQITESHNHSLPVGYVTKGFDAMVNDNGLDLKFRNTTPYPIYIRTYTKDSKAYAEVYGEKMEIKIEKHFEEIEKIQPPEPLILPDEKKEYSDKITYKGEFFTKRYAQFGYKINSYLKIYKDEKLIETRLVRKNTYYPTQSIIYEGIETKGNKLQNEILT
jgi:vancomycin resistance protein YoaR